jgi:hypothetical protein
MSKNIFYWPIVCGPVICKNKPLWDESEPIVPVTLGEAADLNQTDIPGLCLTAVYQLLDEGKITIADVDGAYTRSKERASSSS